MGSGNNEVALHLLFGSPVLPILVSSDPPFTRSAVVHGFPAARTFHQTLQSKILHADKV